MRGSGFFLASLVVWGAQAVAGVRWTAPATWKAQADRPMRAATYTVPPAAGDAEPGECAVYFFGPGQGGSVEANVARWTGQFVDDRHQPAPGSKVQHRIVHGFKVTTIEAAGTYTGMGGPMAATPSVKVNYRLLGAIAEAPQGLVFFKFTGPRQTVAANAAPFTALVDSLAPGK